MQTFKPKNTVGFCHFCVAQNITCFALIEQIINNISIFYNFLKLQNAIFNFFDKSGLPVARAIFVVSAQEKLCNFMS
jgi:hypothetical protein